MTRDSFQTISGKALAEIRVERSRFIANVVPVESRTEAETIYRQLQREYRNATHNCYAYRIGTSQTAAFRYSDDGEPNGTAGKPIYEILLHEDLTNLLVVVTRYFGGIKLGTGGLARAYRDSARAGIGAADRITKYISKNFIVHFNHTETSIVMKVLSEFGVVPEKTEYKAEVNIFASIRQGRYSSLAATLTERSHGKVNVSEV